MGFFKDVATAFKPSNIAKGIEAARNPPSQAEIDAMVAQLSPEDRAKYEQNMAQVERGRQEARESYAQAKAIEDRHRVIAHHAAVRHWCHCRQHERLFALRQMQACVFDPRAARQLIPTKLNTYQLIKKT
ncbi:MAG: hypothetical protein ACEQSX_01450 [Baekduiaceae bacterium]